MVDEGSPLVLDVAGRSSAVEIDAVRGAQLAIVGGQWTRRADGAVEVRAASGAVRITCPPGPVVTASTASGRVRITGSVASAHVITASGTVEVDEVTGDVDIRTASGKVRVSSCGGECRVLTRSGTVQVGTGTALVASTASGKVVAGPLRRADVQTLSGRVELGATDGAEIAARTLSGKVEVSLASAAPAHLELHSGSGRIRSDVARADPAVPGGARVQVRTGSGSIHVRATTREAGAVGAAR